MRKTFVSQLSSYYWRRNLELGVFGLVIIQSYHRLFGSTFSKLIFILLAMPIKRLVGVYGEAASAVPKSKPEERKNRAPQNAQRMMSGNDSNQSAMASLALSAPAVSNSAAQKEKDRLSALGKTTLDNMDTELKENLHKMTLRSSPELCLSIGYAADIKRILCKRGDSGLQVGVEETIVIEGIQNTADKTFVIAILRMIDASYNEAELRKNSIMFDPLVLPDGGSATNTKSMKLMALTVSENFLAFVNRDCDGPRAAANWYFRRNLPDAQAMEFPRTPALRCYLTAASSAGLQKEQIADEIGRQVNNALQGTNLEGKLCAVRISTHQWVKGPPNAKGFSRSYPQQIDLSDGTVRVFFDSTEDVHNMQAFGKPISLSLGEDSSALRADLFLTPSGSKQENDTFFAAGRRLADEKAKAMAKGSEQVYVLETKADVTLKNPGRRTPAEFESLIQDSVGSIMRNVFCVTIALGLQGEPRPDRGILFHLVAKPGSIWPGALHEMLTSKDQKLYGDQVLRIKPRKNEVTITTLQTGPVSSLSESTIKQIIETALYSCPLCIPPTDINGNAVVMTASNPDRVTPLSSLGPVQTITMGGREFRDIRSLFQDQVTSLTLFTALMQLEGREMVTYGGLVDDNGHEFQAMFHVTKDPYAERSDDDVASDAAEDDDSVAAAGGGAPRGEIAAGGGASGGGAAGDGMMF